MGDLCIAINYLHKKHGYQKQFIDDIKCDVNTTVLVKGKQHLSLYIPNAKQKNIEEFDYALDLLFQEQAQFTHQLRAALKYPDLQWVQLDDKNWNQTMTFFLENISILL